jgi:hypothetical protein
MLQTTAITIAIKATKVITATTPSTQNTKIDKEKAARVVRQVSVKSEKATTPSTQNTKIDKELVILVGLFSSAARVVRQVSVTSEKAALVVKQATVNRL